MMLISAQNFIKPGAFMHIYLALEKLKHMQMKL